MLKNVLACSTPEDRKWHPGRKPLNWPITAKATNLNLSYTWSTPMYI